MLKIYNTLAREKQTFTPIVAGKVSMYVCGMTVYDYCHLGHARVMVVFDMVSRWLRASGYNVTYVRNVTDIDDKIIKRANENNETIAQLTQRFIDAMDEDSAKLGVLRPDLEPKATEFVDGMLSMIAALIDKGFAYPAANGDVFYSVSSFQGYGKLSGKSLEDLRAGERVEVDSFKKDPMDFVLWKAAKPGEPSWESPWGKGRPGWHIECSAMSSHHLGQHFDIHGGGQDLQFPHHENEIAQSEAAHSHDGKPCQMVNYWMHNGFVRVDDEKMSKSLGNFFTIRTVLEQYDAEVIRFFILRAHYRSPLNYSDQHLNDAKLALTRLYTALRGVDVSDDAIDWQHPYAARFKLAMDDDFNTPEAMAVLFDLANEVNKTKSTEAAGLLKGLASVLGLLSRKSDEFLQAKTNANGAANDGAAELDVDAMIVKRLEAKQAKNFAEADRIRKELAEAGIILEDTPQGTTWRSA
ncbi:cysteine--tRNA ligase [Methylotenera mobilis]|uniref:Cysteine--tRNA ligase n=1 Tax=Methylotenera mobilis (strain JLW8 / ATCC BAA-1282 / DSM 17540) TaxID=583345 RepID=C6WU22_METML|nr:cysteine--tRNA ligase [Methylotenera mobilis]ACT47421.1 cysteinyl-tRNA synthetase [Methylotenera mobilis JLW8]